MAGFPRMRLLVQVCQYPAEGRGATCNPPYPCKCICSCRTFLCIELFYAVLLPAPALGIGRGNQPNSECFRWTTVSTGGRKPPGAIDASPALTASENKNNRRKPFGQPENTKSAPCLHSRTPRSVTVGLLGEGGSP